MLEKIERNILPLLVYLGLRAVEMQVIPAMAIAMAIAIALILSERSKKVDFYSLKRDFLNGMEIYAIQRNNDAIEVCHSTPHGDVKAILNRDGEISSLQIVGEGENYFPAAR